MEITQRFLDVWNDAHLRNTIISGCTAGFLFLISSLLLFRRNGVVLGSMGGLFLGGWTAVCWDSLSPFGLIFWTDFIWYFGGLFIEGLILGTLIRLDNDRW